MYAPLITRERVVDDVSTLNNQIGFLVQRVDLLKAVDEATVASGGVVQMDVGHEGDAEASLCRWSRNLGKTQRRGGDGRSCARQEPSTRYSFTHSIHHSLRKAQRYIK